MSIVSKAAQCCQIGIIRFWKLYILRSTAPAHIPGETEGCYFSVAGKDSATGPGCRASSWLLRPHSSADPIVLGVSVVEKDDVDFMQAPTGESQCRSTGFRYTNHNTELNTFQKTALGVLSGPARDKCLTMDHQLTVTPELPL